MKDETLLSYEFDFEHYNDAAWLHAVANQPTVHGVTAAILAKLAIELNKRLDSTIQSGNSAQPVTVQDGWIPVSERMPDIGKGILYFCQGDGLIDCGIVSSSNFSGRGDAGLYVYAEGFDLRFGVDITHWQPLPDAPKVML